MLSSTIKLHGMQVSLFGLQFLSREVEPSLKNSLLGGQPPNTLQEILDFSDAIFGWPAASLSDNACWGIQKYHWGKGMRCHSEEVSLPCQGCIQCRGRSRNVEGGVLILCRTVRSNLYWDWHCGRQCIEARSADPSTQSAEKIFHLHYSVVWIGSCTTFVLCTHC